MHTFVRSVVRSLTSSLVRSFVRLFVCSFVRLFVCSFVRLFVCSFVRFFVCSFFRSITLLFMCTFLLCLKLLKLNKNVEHSSRLVYATGVCLCGCARACVSVFGCLITLSSW